MAGLLSSIGSILRYASNVSEDGLAKGTLKTLEDNKMQLLRADGSMLKLLGKYIVEPVAVVSKDLADVEELDHILGLHMDMFTGFYMQAFDILDKQHKLSMTTVVDTLATDNGGLERVLTAGLESGLKYTIESDEFEDYIKEMTDAGMELTFEADTTVPEEIDEDTLRKLKASRDEAAYIAHGKAIGTNRAYNITNEAGKKYNEANATASGRADAERVAAAVTRKELKDAPSKDRAHLANKDFFKEATRLSEAHKDLLIPNAIQRSIEITVDTMFKEPGTDGVYHTRTFIIPVTIRLAVIFTDNENILNAIETQGPDYTFSSRLDEYRAGAISLADFVFATDLVKKYKKHKIKDKDALMTLMKFRELSANSKMITNGFAGFEKYYNMFFVSPTTKVMIEKSINAKLSSTNGKERFLDRGYGLSVTVVDPDYERIQIMLKDVRGKSDLSFRNAVKKDKGGSDYGEIIKALMANKTPTF